MGVSLFAALWLLDAGLAQPGVPEKQVHFQTRGAQTACGVCLLTLLDHEEEINEGSEEERAAESKPATQNAELLAPSSTGSQD